jgi:hypothetical protein
LTIVVSRVITNAASSSENRIKGFLFIAASGESWLGEMRMKEILA